MDKLILKTLTTVDIDRIVEMAWEDRTTFDTIHEQFGISETEVIKIMRKSMKRSSFLMWRERVNGRKTKHAITSESQRFRCSQQEKPKSKNS
ncbi:TIGR03643 family protein [Pseudanabaena sp. SR411]|uniref:TIGR03643 family protein n=1 Tax=Pseudanabaena sp. SR411 TaxID=1980935 RepID=UPI000B98263F|nr:TIGR03643 family protein [Pseudanabaena sp. SR411]OYQ63794.1 TIGR03643 family protein [Pseudanabaena sp. SR411]